MIMPLTKPYRRLIRPFTAHQVVRGWEYQRGAVDTSYLSSAQYGPDRSDFVRAYRLLEDDLIQIFEYVQPADINFPTYSHRLFQLLLRASTEFEANAKAVLGANGYSKSSNLNITDYFKLESACRLSEYRLKTPVWSDQARTFAPFASWNGSATYTPLPWYQAYNDVKHNRTASFPEANFKNVVDSVAAVFVVLFAQYYIYAFDPYRPVGMYHEDGQGYLSHSTPLFHILPPQGWVHAETYDFDWGQLESQANPFQNFPF